MPLPVAASHVAVAPAGARRRSSRLLLPAFLHQLLLLRRHSRLLRAGVCAVNIAGEEGMARINILNF